MLWRYCVDCAVATDARSRYLLYLGTLQPRKNLARLLEAFAKVASRPGLTDVNLILAGKKGWLYNQLFALVELLGLEGRVIFPRIRARARRPRFDERGARFRLSLTLRGIRSART